MKLAAKKKIRTGNSAPTVVLVNDTSTKPHVGCKLTVDGIKCAVGRAGLSLVGSLNTSERWDNKVNRKILLSADCVIVNGEGVMHGEKEKAHRLASLGPFCKKNNIPVYLVNSVFQSKSDSIIENLTFFNRLFVRESASNGFMKCLGLNAEVVPDAIFASDLARRGGGDSKGAHEVLVTDSVDSSVSDSLGYWVNTHYPYVHGLSVKVPDAEFHRIKSSMFSFFSSRFKASPSSEKSNRFSSFAEETDLPMLLSRIASARLVVTGRFHVLCLCLMYGVPFISLSSNTKKNEGLLRDLGLTHLLITPDELISSSIEELVHMSRYSVVEGVSERFRSDVDGMFSSICSDLKG